MIVFVESFPERVDEAMLRQALTMLCAAASPDQLYIHVDENELSAALEIVRRAHHG
jgi:hypothetical protein